MNNCRLLRFEEADGAVPVLTLIDENGDAETLDVTLHVWQRLEKYIAYRWSPRQVVWTLESSGGGIWSAHLAPVSAAAIDIWDDTLKTWSAASVDPTPTGYSLPQRAIYRVTAVCGADAGDVPQAVAEAYRRLASYCVEAEQSHVPVGVSNYSETIGELTHSFVRSPSFLAKALQNSGAADMLRTYRLA